MLALKFYKILPGGNVTILVEDLDFSQTERSRISAQLMQSQHLYAEQVGFINLSASGVDSYPHLEMMGGEFCGNACRCFGALLAFNGHLERQAGQEYTEQASLRGRITSSGVTQEVELRATLTSGISGTPVVPGQHGISGTPGKSGAFRPTSANVGVGVSLSDAESACSEIIELVPGAHLVHLSGISHLLLDERVHHKRGDLLLQATQWRARFSLSVHDAVGVIWYNQEHPAITPVVWVKAMRSAHLESACGSGSLALALLLQRFRSGTAGTEVAYGSVCGPMSGMDVLEVSVMQPSGSFLDISLPSDFMRTLAWIDGPVDLIATGEVFVDPDYEPRFL